MMKLRTSGKRSFGHAKQRGVVLFFALIALVVMSLAAVALIRSTDTSTMIAGNLALRQAAITSGDAGTEAAMSWLQTTQAGTALDIMQDITHPLNITNASLGYYSNVAHSDVADFYDGTVDWDNSDSVAIGEDSSGNTVRYIIERMCRNPNQVASTANCLFASAEANIKDATQLQGYGGTTSTIPIQSTQFRITAKIEGKKNTVSYIQSFVY